MKKLGDCLYQVGKSTPTGAVICVLGLEKGISKILE